MKKLIFILTVLFFSTNTVFAQWWSSSERISGNKEMVKQTRSISDYDQVSVTGMMEVQLVAGKEGRIDIEAESNLLELIETEVSGGHLKISVKKGYNLQPSNNHPIRLVVPFESIYAVTLTGSGNISNRDEIREKDFDITVTGSGNVNLSLVSQNLEGSITGSGDVILRGNTENFKVKVTGSGDFLAYDLQANNIDASVLGSGDIEISPGNELNAKIAGSGDIKYRGNPGKQNFKTTGSGSVSKS